jgi:xanthine/uracil/vitamin C permease (AzgA family)
MTVELLIAFGIMGLCVVIHVAGIVLLGEQLVRQRERIEERVGFVYSAVLLMIVFAAAIFLHIIEATIWAAFYRWGSLFPDFETALYFSLTSYSTLGYGDAVLPQNWRLLGTMEGISGVLLCGLSAAFLFAIVNALFRFRVRRFMRDKPHRTES